MALGSRVGALSMCLSGTRSARRWLSRGERRQHRTFRVLSQLLLTTGVVALLVARALVPGHTLAAFVTPAVGASLGVAQASAVETQPCLLKRAASRRGAVAPRFASEGEDDVISGLAEKVEFLKSQKGSETPVRGAEFVSPLEGLFGGRDEGLNPRDKENYITVELAKPLGLGLGEAGSSGGVVVTELQPDSSADKSGQIQPGYVLIAAGDKGVHNLPFEEALQPIKDADSPVRLTFFVGGVDDFYGKRKPSAQWMENFVKKLAEPAGGAGAAEKPKEGDSEW